MSTESAFLERVRAALKRRGPSERSAHPGWSGTEWGEGHQAIPPSSREELVNRFCAEWQRVGGRVLVVGRGSLAAELQELLRQKGVRSVLLQESERWQGLGLVETLTRTGIEVHFWPREAGSTVPRNGEGVPNGRQALLRAAAAADAGIAWADYAIADTGTVVECASAGRGRVVSLLPPIYVAFIDPERVVATRGEVLRRVNEDGTMPSGLVFITGPSRTADIENDLSIGVHGPGEVWAVVVRGS